MELPIGTYKVLPSRSGLSGAVVTVTGTIHVHDDDDETKDPAHHHPQAHHSDEPEHGTARRSQSRTRTLSIDIQTSAGVAIVDDRTYTFAWHQDEEEHEEAPQDHGVHDIHHTGNRNRSSRSSTPQSGTLTLEDTVFGSAKRTTLGPVRYDAAAHTLTVQALWTRTFPVWFGGAYTVQVPIRTVLQHTPIASTATAAAAATTLPTTRTITNTSLPSPVLVAASSLASSFASPSKPSPAPLLLPPTAAVPSISVSRYRVFDAYIRRTSEQCAF